jgi:CubicO group peptidase (beta-lactamase class C family)
MVMTAQDKTRKINYAKAIGTASLKEAAKPMGLDTTFWLASMSKLITSIAALQSVDRGDFTLDEDVTRILPEFKGIQILKGFNEETGDGNRDVQTLNESRVSESAHGVSKCASASCVYRPGSGFGCKDGLWIGRYC